MTQCFEVLPSVIVPMSCVAIIKHLKLLETNIEQYIFLYLLTDLLTDVLLSHPVPF